MSKSYYYLIAGMPEIAFDHKKLVFKQDEFKTYLQEELAPEDFDIIQNLYLKYDNENLLKLIFNKDDDTFNDLGVYKKDELIQALKEPEGLNPYLIQFISEYLVSDNKDSVIFWEHRLTTLYYEYLFNIKNDFLRNWFHFEFMTNTVVTAYNSRKYGFLAEEQLILTDENIQAVAKSGAKDFGLTVDWPSVNNILNIFEIENILKREEALDRFRWDWIDEKMTFEYFSFEVVISMLLKLRIIDRWINADPENGKRLFRQLLEDIKSSSKKEI
ncbi:MAG: DUF2764 domain-containing protein [Bacteroidales bacterium]|jgi:hypothetical protein|nr:DUF2764 domain-containing protein [Bacteroidales bacterium]